MSARPVAKERTTQLKRLWPVPRVAGCSNRRIYPHPEKAEPFTFDISSVMKTAIDRDACDGERSASSENEALRRAVRMLTQDYEDAIRRGEMPDDAWLVEPSPAQRR